MDAEYRTRLMAYRTSMSLAADMLFQGIITKNDYDKIDRIIAKRNGLSLSSICCRDPLLYKESRATAEIPPGKPASCSRSRQTTELVTPFLSSESRIPV